MNTFYTSDTHFGHAACWERFKNADGEPMRPFTSTEEMDQVMVERWNSVVQPGDRVFHLGDVVMNKRYIPVLERLNGEKHLIIGNHDIHHLDLLAPHFKSMSAMRIVKGIVFTHFPVHPDQIPRFGTNVHGHTHDTRVMVDVPVKHPLDDEWTTAIDPRYFCICVEQIDYTPVEIGDLRGRIARQVEESKNVTPDLYNKITGATPWGNGSGPG